MDINIKKLNDRISLLHIRTNKFKASKVEITLITPIVKGNLASTALLPFCLTRTTAKYNTPQRLSFSLADLYGAAMSVAAYRAGDNLHSVISLTSVSNTLALNKENIFELMFELLDEILLNPNVENDRFAKEYFDNEKRLEIEKIDNEINDKRKYAIKKAIEIICEDEPFGLSKASEKTELEKLTSKQLFDIYLGIIKSAKISITIISNERLDLENRFFERLLDVESAFVPLNVDITKPARENPVELSESFDVNQSKLVLGFRSIGKKTLKESAKAKVMADVFGGGPYSLLFENVREKESLCYYCSATYERKKGILMVDSGVETESVEKAKAEIQKYFEAIKKGEFDKAVLEASKRGMAEAYAAIPDSIDAVSKWYSAQLDEEEVLSPTDFIEAIEKVTYEDVVSAANEFDLDTVFTVKSL